MQGELAFHGAIGDDIRADRDGGFYPHMCIVARAARESARVVFFPTRAQARQIIDELESFAEAKVAETKIAGSQADLPALRAFMVTLCKIGDEVVTLWQAGHRAENCGRILATAKAAFSGIK